MKKTTWAAGWRFRGVTALAPLAKPGHKAEPSRKSDLETEKLEAEVSKLKLERALIERKADLDVLKLQAEIRDLRRHFLLRNVAPVATLVVGLLSIGGTVWLNTESSAREKYRRVHEGIARQLLVHLSEPESVDRIAAARQLGQLDPDVIYTIVSDGYAASRANAKLKPSGEHPRSASTYFRAGIMEVASLPTRESALSIKQRVAFLIQGLEDVSPLVRYKAHVGLVGMGLKQEVQEELVRAGSKLDVAHAYANERDRLTPKFLVRQKYRMVVIPKVVAVIGSDFDEQNERPAVEVSLETFAIDEDLVTNGEWQALMGDELPLFEEMPVLELTNWRKKDPQAKSRPVLGVSFKQAKNFCGRTGRRLPTEVEWEVAARGTSGWLYPWGDDLAINTRVLEKEAQHASKPGQLTTLNVAALSEGMPNDISAFGIKRMVTSVRQWTDSEYSPASSLHRSKNMPCSSQCTTRGSSGSAIPSERGDTNRMRASRRDLRGISEPDDVIGFRCAMTIK